MDSEIALPGKGSPEISGIALIRAPKMGVGNYFSSLVGLSQLRYLVAELRGPYQPAGVTEAETALRRKVLERVDIELINQNFEVLSHGQISN